VIVCRTPSRFVGFEIHESFAILSIAFRGRCALFRLELAVAAIGVSPENALQA